MNEQDTYKEVGGITVRKARMCSDTTWHTYDAWRKSDDILAYSTFTIRDGQLYGRVGTERPPEKVKTADEYYRWLAIAYDHAYSLITLAFPESAIGIRDAGQIELIDAK